MQHAKYISNDKLFVIGAFIGLFILAFALPLHAFADNAGNSHASSGEVQSQVPVLSPAAIATPALTSTAAPAATTNTATVADGPYIITSALRSSAALDVSGANKNNGAKVQIYDTNTTPAQRWRIERIGKTSYYRIVNVGSGKVLDVAGGTSKAGTRVQQYAWNNSAAQKWKIAKVSGGYRIISALSNKLVLDVAGANKRNGTGVQIYTANGTKAQVWKLSKVTQVLANGTYNFTNKGSGKGLDVAGGSANTGGNVQQYGGNSQIHQAFFARFDSKSGYYTLTAAHSGMVLDVSGASTKNGANVQQWTSNNTPAQRWTITKNSDGSLTLKNAASGKVLDVSGGSKANGANVQQWTSNGTAAQKWTAKKASTLVADGIYNIIPVNNSNTSLGVAKDAMGSGANVQTTARKDTTWAQCWVIVQDKSNPGYYTIRNLNSRMALEVKGASKANGANVVQAGKTSKTNQLWKPVVTAGGIMWQSKLDSGKVLDLAGGKKNAGTNVQLYARNNSAAQKFRLQKDSLGSLLKSTAVVIRNMETNTVLDVASASTKNGAKLQLYTSNGTSAQKFRFRTNGNAYAIMNTNSSKFIDVDTNTKTKLQIWEGGKSTSQRWKVAFDYGTATFTFTSSYTGKRLDGTGGVLSQKAGANKDAQRWILQPTTADYFRVYLNSGHGWNSNGNGAWDTGARGAGVEEAVFASDLCDRIIKIGREQYGLDIVDGRPYKLAYWKRLPKAIELGCSTIFSVHFDAGGGSGPMTMVGVDGRHPASLTFEGIMRKHLYASLPGLTHRGLFYRNDITCVNGNIPAVLVEVCFMDNPSDVAYYQARKDTVARELAAGLYEASQVQSLRKNM